MIDLVKLIRWKNLIIIATTMIIVWLSIQVAVPFLEILSLNIWYALMLISSTLLIAAGGYIINDYFDSDIDAVNKPDMLIVGKSMTKNKAFKYYLLFNFIGLDLAFMTALFVGNWLLVWISVLSIILLWLYSQHFKKQLLIGNLLVAFLTALSIIQVVLFEPGLYPYFSESFFIHSDIFNPVYLIFGTAVFAFLLNWIRELIKDMEDKDGDEKFGCRTFPIVYGIRTSVKMVIILAILVLLLLMIPTLYFIWINRYLSAALSLIIVISLIDFINKFDTDQSKIHYEKMTKKIKWTMLLGLIWLFVISLGVK